MKEDKYAPIQQETPGMVSPDKPKIKKNKKTVLVFFAVAFVAIVFAGLFGMRSLGLFGKKAVPVPAEVQTSEMQLKQLLEERRELESRIRTLEEERENLQTNMAEMLAKRVEPLQRQVEELESIRNEISSLRREMANLVVVRKKKSRKKNGSPRKGRTARPSYSLNLPNITKGSTSSLLRKGSNRNSPRRRESKRDK